MDEPAQKRQEKPVGFDHHDPGFVTDHREIYAALRQECPVAFSQEHGGFWVLSRYQDVVAVAQNDRDFTSRISLLIPPGNIDRMIPLQSDPPDTRRYRQVLMPYFARENIDAQAPAIRRDIRSAIDQLLEAGRGDVVGLVAIPVPARATMRLLGLPIEMWPTFADPIHHATHAEPGSADYRRAEEEIRAFGKIIAAEVEARKAVDRHDMISDLVHRPHGTDSLTTQEVIDLVRMVIFGGMDTVTGAIANMTAILAADSTIQSRLRKDPGMIQTAVEEFLRFEAPIQGFARKTNCPVRIGRQTIDEGERVWLNWGSANHDPEVFDDPDRLDITRCPNRHLAFGIGQHICLGARLARMELQIFLGELLSRAPQFVLDERGIELPRTIGQLLGKKRVGIRFAMQAG